MSPSARRATGRPLCPIGMLALAATFVTSCGDAASHRDAPRPHDGGITRPGVVLIAPRPRAGALAALPTELKAHWCPAFDDHAPAMVQRLQSLPDGPDTSAEPFALAVMEDAGAALAGDRPAATRLARLLDRWARLVALRPVGPPDVNRNYALDRALLPTLVAVGVLGADPALAEGERERVVDWLGTLIRSRPRPAAASITRRNNHHYLRGSVDAAWGALTGDAASFASGLSAYRDAIGDLRPDGSLPLETARGPRALWYQRHALASLVVIAEIAANQGIDLYGYSVDGRNLHLAVRFLLDAIADPKLVQPYSGADSQDLSFLQRRGHHRNYMAWAEIYAARFPGRIESARLLRLVREADPDFRPMIDDYSGGNTTCLFAAP
ncbi:MAG: alginate lyase family protein [Geminicoccaceae bacterium]